MKKKPIGLAPLCKIGTLAHNRAFSPRDFREYAGHQASLAALVRRGIVERGARGQYYPTARGWRAIERACRLYRPSWDARHGLRY